MNNTIRYILCMDKFKKPAASDINSAIIAGVIFQVFVLGFYLFDLIGDRMFCQLVGIIVWVMLLNACNLGIWVLGWRHFVLLFCFSFLWEAVYTSILG
ncbi:hypothetical protein [Pseudomonas sp. CFBP 13719]|uniref:hypothetical protein n=1 Tax=Pseudomonas sp. CFBP 13719 TaxID=2775303 RepID=UPI0017868821|nr:hypothetical protein [Pseudomonas putida]MBD8681357.1 hypothetical protein [Pseudomonas sp. CFBP 13719]